MEFKTHFRLEIVRTYYLTFKLKLVLNKIGFTNYCRI